MKRLLQKLNLKVGLEFAHMKNRKAFGQRFQCLWSNLVTKTGSMFGGVNAFKAKNSSCFMGSGTVTFHQVNTIINENYVYIYPPQGDIEC